MYYSKKFIEEIQNLNSREIVGYTLEKLHRENSRIVCVYADVGSRFSIKGKLGADEIEIGIAEQTLIPLLGGLCHEGHIPFGIAYAPFITMRAADQIRMTIGQMGLGIKLIGGSAGLVSGNLGAASLALDDLAAIRAIPNVVIISPSDPLSEVKAIEYAANNDLPLYIRLTGGKMGTVYERDFEFGENKKSNVVFSSGRDAVIYTTGCQTFRTIRAARKLEMLNIKVTVIDMLFVKPLDERILDLYSDIELVISVEEHNVIGGLGGAISEYISGHTKQRLLRMGVNDNYLFPDSYNNLLITCGLDTDSLVRKIYGIITGEVIEPYYSERIKTYKDKEVERNDNSMNTINLGGGTQRYQLNNRIVIPCIAFTHRTELDGGACHVA